MSVVTLRELLECGVHFGHQTKRWNPKMAKYIFTARNDIHVIDLQQTLKLIEKSYEVVRDLIAKNKKILFVGTKKQAQDAIRTEAERCGMYYVNQRWLGGTLTNFITIRKSINKLKALEKAKESNQFESLTKKEIAKKIKEINKLSFYFNGIRDMIKVPDILFIIDTKKEHLAIKEANKMGIPVIGIIDTNADPTEVKYPIPANDDAIRAIKLLCTIFAKSVLEGQQIGGIPAAPVEQPVSKEPKEIEIKEELPIELFEEEKPVVIKKKKPKVEKKAEEIAIEPEIIEEVKLKKAKKPAEKSEKKKATA